jgi:hypothetical protein
MLMVEPQRENDRIDNELPKFKQSRIDNELPSCTNPYIESELPRRMKLLKLRAEPKFM